MCVMCRSFPTKLNEGKQHVKITYCHHILSRVTFSTYVGNYILFGSNDIMTRSVVYWSNSAFKMWPKSIIFSDLTWNLFKLAIRRCITSLEKVTKDCRTLKNFRLTVSPKCLNQDWALWLECPWAQVQRNIANASSASIALVGCRP